ncbi:cob(I)yrinic acid a,c-diamide adenosyltransferase [Oscillospiraceae bacterium WX1]
MSNGLTHVYYGYGKGKTTAALGLALRASGCGKKVLLVQFLKDSNTGELCNLKILPGVTVLRGTAAKKFVRDMTPDELAETKRLQNDHLKKAVSLVEAGNVDLLILDEALDAYQLGLLDETLFLELVFNKPSSLELVITGHRPDEKIMAAADYVTEMVKHKHPFDNGIKARRGVEF